MGSQPMRMGWLGTSTQWVSCLAVTLLLWDLFGRPLGIPLLEARADGRYPGRGARVPWVARAGVLWVPRSRACNADTGEHTLWMPRRGEEVSMRCGCHGWGVCSAGTQGGERVCHQSGVVLLFWGRLRSFRLVKHQAGLVRAMMGTKNQRQLGMH